MQDRDKKEQDCDKKQIIINVEKLETRVGLLNRNELEEYQIERSDDQGLVGSIYLARIVNHEPTLQAAFVDIGEGRNAFLHYWDMLPGSHDMVDKIAKDGKEDSEGGGGKKKKPSNFAKKLQNLFVRRQRSVVEEIIEKRQNEKLTVEDVPKIFPAGSAILVQVQKGPIGTKGPRVTTNLAIPGRYLVLLPYSDNFGLSKKIEEKKERDRLRGILTSLELPEKVGLICRTVGEGRKSVFFTRDLDMLLDIWHQVEVKLQSPKIPCKVYSEPNLLERTVRDVLTEDIDEIVVDNQDAYEFFRKSLDKLVGGDFAEKVSLHRKAAPIFDFYKVTEQVDRVFRREVPLPSGGYICIDETEALIAIDVNTGKNRKGKDQPEIILQTNLEAAEAVARQLRLRNVGGLVVIDFIDMRSSRDRDKVTAHMRKLVRDDRAKTRIIPISRLGLMEMTRQRENESLKDTVFDPCPYCGGSGRVKSTMSMSVEIQRALTELLKRYSRDKDIGVRLFVNPSVLARLKNEDANILIDLENKYGRNLSFRADPTLHHEQFRLVDAVTGAELK